MKYKLFLYFHTSPTKLFQGAAIIICELNIDLFSNVKLFHLQAFCTMPNTTYIKKTLSCQSLNRSTVSNGNCGINPVTKGYKICSDAHNVTEGETNKHCQVTNLQVDPCESYPTDGSFGCVLCFNIYFKFNIIIYFNWMHFAKKVICACSCNYYIISLFTV